MISPLPRDLAIVAIENSVFRRRRSDLPLADELGQYTNSAQVVLGFFQNINHNDVLSLYSPGRVTEIIAASRVLDAASEELFGSEELDEETLHTAIATGLLAILANAIYGNFPAANTIAKRFLDVKATLAPFHICVVCCCAPEFIGKYLAVIRQNPNARAFLESTEAFLRTGELQREATLRRAFLNLRNLLESAFDHSLWMSFEICFEQLINLCIAKLLPQLLGPTSGDYVALLTKAGLRTFLPPQFLALTKDNLVTREGNAVICLPTSTGKTLLSEISIFSTVKRSGRIGVFVIPYVALGRQIADRVSRRLPNDWKLVRFFGGYKEPNAFINDDKKMFVVGTPERIDALLRFNSDILARIDCIVFDEAHMIESGQRGARLEGLIARILLAQSQGLVSRLIAVSAVVPNVNRMAQWIQADPGAVVNHVWSPSCRRMAIWKSTGQLIWYHSADPVTPPGSEPDVPIASIRLPWPQRIVPTRWDYAEAAVFEDKNYDNLVYLCEFMWQREQQPILCVCANRETTRRTASQLGKRLDVISPTLPETQKAIDLISTKYPHYRLLKLALLSGVAYHNASLPHDLRALIEDAIWHKELRCVVSTTTLAEGVDLPFRVTILADWVRYQGKNQVPYSPLLVRNISGRCGRVGYFTEGDIVIYDNPLGDRKLKAPGLKEELQNKVFFGKNDEGVKGAVEASLDDAAVRATLASQYLAAVAENGEKEQIEHEFASRLFGGTADQANAVQDFLQSVTGELVEGDFPLATRNSPLQLTPLGVAVNHTGFSPASCKRIIQRLQETSAETSEDDLLVSLLAELGDLPEQGDFRFTSLVDREKYNKLPTTRKKRRPPKTYVRIEFLSQIISAWIAGEQPIQIFANLPTVLESSITPTFAEWLEGTDEITSWDGEFDKFSDFVSTTIFEFLPWLLRACSILSPFSNDELVALNWQRLAEKVQRDSVITATDDNV